MIKINKIKTLLILSFLLIFTGCSHNNPNNKINGEITNNINNEIKQEIQIRDIFFDALKTNKDGSEYITKFPNTQIIEYKKISPNEFTTLENATDFKELYKNLPNKNLYLVKFHANKSQISLQTIIDKEEKKVINIVGIFIMEMN